ncbi:hypothetical protein ZWY2020_052842 [Hordeum vulgare]|nr:hypothetical protein ZWY2020_052842 [Hordeum vulgare]
MVSATMAEAEREAAALRTLVVRKPGFGLPAACPTCLPVLLSPDADEPPPYLPRNPVSSCGPCELDATDAGAAAPLLERALEASGDDLDDAINSLKELHLMESNQANQSATGSTFEMSRQQSPFLLMLAGIVASSGVDTTTQHQPGADSHQVSNTRPKCVDLFVRETSNVSEMDDARAHVSRALEALMKSILEGAGAEAAQSLHQNAVLKRAVEIQDERQKEFDERSHEVQGLKHLVVQYQEELRTLEGK